jgi:hypothetical protein
MSLFANHLTCPLRTMFTVSMPESFDMPSKMLGIPAWLSAGV